MNAYAMACLIRDKLNAAPDLHATCLEILKEKAFDVQILFTDAQGGAAQLWLHNSGAWQVDAGETKESIDTISAQDMISFMVERFGGTYRPPTK